MSLSLSIILFSRSSSSDLSALLGISFSRAPILWSACALNYSKSDLSFYNSSLRAATASASAPPPSLLIFFTFFSKSPRAFLNAEHIVSRLSTLYLSKLKSSFVTNFSIWALILPSSSNIVLISCWLTTLSSLRILTSWFVLFNSSLSAKVSSLAKISFWWLPNLSTSPSSFFKRSSREPIWSVSPFHLSMSSCVIFGPSYLGVGALISTGWPVPIFDMISLISMHSRSNTSVSHL